MGDPKEVAAFAKSQGLDAASVTQEFMDIDLNGDGNLDANEIAAALGTTPEERSTETAAEEENAEVDDDDDSAVETQQEKRRKAIAKGRRKLDEEREERETIRKVDAEAVLNAERSREVKLEEQAKKSKKSKEDKASQHEEKAPARHE